MSVTRGRSIVAIAAIAVLCMTSDALAWGPATHVKLATDILAHLSLLPAAVAAIIAAHRRHFMYGNVATDTVLAKKMSQVKQVCHRWSTGMSLLDSANSDSGKAFAYGYLAHLAADTVAHNKFLPRQMAVSRSTVTFGHIYWEVRSDAKIAARHWASLRRLLRGSYEEPETMLERHLQATMLSFKTNRAIFKQVNRLASLRAWQRSVDFWAKMSRHTLDPVVIRAYHEESLGRIVDLLEKGKSSSVLQADPNGNATLAYAKAQKRQIRQLRRARIPHTDLIREAAAGHAPLPNRAIALTID